MNRNDGGRLFGPAAGAALAALAGAALLAGGARLVLADMGTHALGANPKKATATIDARSGSQVKGKATFEKMQDHLHVTVEISGATPGEHGVHIHEKGDCSAPDASSAGPHFNPAGKTHGGPNAPMHHAGDFGNITVGADGKGKLALMSQDIGLDPGPHSVRGRAMVIHEKADDLKSQPAGNAGARIGCGVIR